MERAMATFSFEVPFDHVQANIDEYVSAIFSSLESEFLIVPRGLGFIEYAVFEMGYEALKRATSGFTHITGPVLFDVALESPISLTVLRTMLGFTPSEWAYITTRCTGVEVSQGFARNLDRQIRMAPHRLLTRATVSVMRIKALIEAACQLLSEGALYVEAGKIHRLDKADTKTGLDALRTIAGMGVPYAMLLYERFLGRPFAGHRDSVSELVGDSLESAIEDILSNAGISYRKTKRAERVPGFDQAPDFVIPSEFNPQEESSQCASALIS
jgi:hypothetical protein